MFAVIFQDLIGKSIRQAAISATPESVAGGRLKFTSTRPLAPETVTGENFVITDNNGNEVTGEIILSENDTVILFKPENKMADGNYTLTVAQVKDLSGNEIAFVEAFAYSEENVASLAAPSAVCKDGNIEILFLAADGEIANKDEITVTLNDEKINGTFVQRDNAVVFIADNGLIKEETYKVIIPETIRTVDGVYLEAEVSRNVFIRGAYTKSVVTRNGMTWLVQTDVYNVPDTCEIIVAGYMVDKLVEFDSKPYNGTSETFIMPNAIDHVKIMLWDGIKSLKCIGEVETIQGYDFQ